LPPRFDPAGQRSAESNRRPYDFHRLHENDGDALEVKRGLRRLLVEPLQPVVAHDESEPVLTVECDGSARHDFEVAQDDPFFDNMADEFLDGGGAKSVDEVNEAKQGAGSRASST
jgi:hypothetical protein